MSTQYVPTVEDDKTVKKIHPKEVSGRVSPELLEYLTNRHRRSIRPQGDIYAFISNDEMRDRLFGYADVYEDFFGETSPLVCADPFSVTPNAGAQPPIAATRNILGMEPKSFTEKQLECIKFTLSKFFSSCRTQAIVDRYDATFIKHSNAGAPSFSSKMEAYREDMNKAALKLYPDSSKGFSVMANGLRLDQFVRGKSVEGKPEGWSGKFAYVHLGPKDDDWGFIPIHGGTINKRAGKRPRLVYGASKVYGIPFSAYAQALNDTFKQEPFYESYDLSPDNLYTGHPMNGVVQPKYRADDVAGRFYVDLSNFDMTQDGFIQLHNIGVIFPPLIAQMYLWNTAGPLYGVYADTNGDPVFWSTRGKGFTIDMLLDPKKYWDECAALAGASMRSGENGHSPIHKAQYNGLQYWVYLTAQSKSDKINDDTYMEAVKYFTTTGTDGGIHDYRAGERDKVEAAYNQLPFKVNMDEPGACGMIAARDDQNRITHMEPNAENLFWNNLSREHAFDSPLGVKAPFSGHYSKVQLFLTYAEGLKDGPWLDMLDVYMDQFGLDMDIDDLRLEAEAEQNYLEKEGIWPADTVQLLKKLGWNDPSEGFYKDYPSEFEELVNNMMQLYQSSVTVNMEGFKLQRKLFGTIADPVLRTFTTQTLVLAPSGAGKTSLCRTTDLVDLDEFGTSEVAGYDWFINFDQALTRHPNASFTGVSQNWTDIVVVASARHLKVVCLYIDDDLYETQLLMRETLDANKENYAPINVMLEHKKLLERDCKERNIELYTIEQLFDTLTKEIKHHE